MPPNRTLGPRQHTRAVLLIGFALFAGVFVAQSLITRYLAASTEERSRRLERDAILSIEALNRISRDTERIGTLVDDHIHATAAPEMASIEKQIDVVADDLDRAAELYKPLVEFPNEAKIWQSASASIDRLRTSVVMALALSRKNMDREARAQWLASRGEFADLDPRLDSLIAINREGAIEAMTTTEAAYHLTRRINDAVKVLALAGLAALSYWLFRRVMDYERRLEKTAALLADQNRDLDAFAGRVAHDLQNTLSPIMMVPEMLERDADNPSRVRELAGRTGRVAHRAAQTIDALLAFSQGVRVSPEEAADVRPVVEGVVDEVREQASSVSATVEVGDIPDMTVRCAAGLLHAVLANLLGNAVKFLATRPERRVRVQVYADDGSCRFDVMDTGPGIPKREQEAIFEPFHRGESAAAPGTGIGLATVRRIVDAHGGRIAVDSDEGRGACFSVWLPLASQAA